MTCELNVCNSTVRDWTIEFIDEQFNLFNLIFQSRTDEESTDFNECTSQDWNSSLLDLNGIASEQANPTTDTVLKWDMIIYCLDTNHEAIICYHASDTILKIFCNTAFLVLTQAQSWAASIYHLGWKDNKNRTSS